MASKILGSIEFFSHSSGFDENILDVVLHYRISDFDPSVNYGQIVVRVDANQSEMQFVNEVKTLTADYINATLGTSFNIADVIGCNI